MEDKMREDKRVTKETEPITESTNKQCICTGCGHEQKSAYGVPCAELVCPKCQGMLTDKK